MQKSYLATLLPLLFVAACNSTGNGVSSNGTNGNGGRPATVISCSPCKIFVTNGSYNGGLESGVLAYGQKINIAEQLPMMPASPPIVIGNGTAMTGSGVKPYESSFKGADFICNSEAHESGLPGNYKALLNNNSATVSGMIYKNINNQTVAIATGANLVGFGESLSNVILSLNGESGTYTWTGFTPNMDVNYSGWATGVHGYESGVVKNSCKNWTSPSADDSGVIGQSNAINQTVSQSYNWNNESPIATAWAEYSAIECQEFYRFICVQQ